jgi:hypothetical protein
MASELKPITSDRFVETLIANGVVPPLCRRVVIDAEAGSCVKLYYEVYGDERLLEVGIPDALLNVVTGQPDAAADEPAVVQAAGGVEI